MTEPSFHEIRRDAFLVVIFHKIGRIGQCSILPGRWLGSVRLSGRLKLLSCPKIGGGGSSSQLVPDFPGAFGFEVGPPAPFYQLFWGGFPY